jgi:hypothetical protein
VGKRTGRVLTTDAEIRAAVAWANAREQDDLRVTSARYDSAQDRIVIALATGIEIAVPRIRIPGLETATPAHVATVQILGPGSALEWPTLDVGCDVLELLCDTLGLPDWRDVPAPWMSAIGRKGGSRRRAAKTKAAQANGKKGGRPRTSVNCPVRFARAAARRIARPTQGPPRRSSIP